MLKQAYHMIKQAYHMLKQAYHMHKQAYHMIKQAYHMIKKVYHIAMWYACTSNITHSRCSIMWYASNHGINELPVVPGWGSS